MFKISLLCVFLYATQVSEAYKALVVYPLPVKSHSILGDGIVRHLLEDGHEVTYVTTFPKSLKQHPSLREINISSQLRLMPEDVINIEKIIKKETVIEKLLPLIKMIFDIQISCIEHEEVRELLNDPKEQFDVVIVEWMFLELMSGISAVFNCPYIWVSSLDPHWMVLKLIDEIPNPAYTADAQSTSVIPFTFLQRATELVKISLGVVVQYCYVSGDEHKEFERLFGPFIRKRGLYVPDFEDVRYNASLMLGNSHVSLGQATRLPQNYKGVGGYHIDVEVKPLPENLKKLLDSAKYGVIYFSMGSNLRSKHMPTELKASLLKMFGELKQTVLWKFEEDLPNRPSNVHIIQWAPQQSILAHQNCILFITHGGLLSTTEAVHFGKPIIGIPAFGDQFNNVDRSVKRGFAKRVDLSYTMADELGKAIEDMTTDPSYSIKVKELSFIYHDRPVSPGKEVAHWVNHVVRTGGAPHLRSPALMVPWYQKCYLDLAASVIVLVYAAAVILKKLFKSFFKNQEKKKMQ